MATVNLITLTEPRSAAAEAFRTLRTNLTFNDKLHTILMTSAASPDGKSAAIANLAVTLAQSGHRTILVDADLRQPTQHQIWGVDGQRGLSTMMQENALLASPPLVPTTVDNLSLLPAGAPPSIPTDVISNPRMSEIIGVLKARAQYVLFEAPPVLVASDASLLGLKVDGTVLVIRAGHTRKEQAIRAQEALSRLKVTVLGTVLLNAPRENVINY
ncbi:MAG: CpsD/CapB family tyrosine-protein kinase [Anaerolineae bacterium]|jgi:non-specific protein-tyrosine kinase|nr:CpsD/CapB family tyrosine-protein kinase [Anaerolineae bacterium]